MATTRRHLLARAVALLIGSTVGLVACGTERSSSLRPAESVITSPNGSVASPDSGAAPSYGTHDEDASVTEPGTTHPSNEQGLLQPTIEFVTATRAMPAWQTVRLAASGISAYTSDANAAVIGKVIGIGPIEERQLRADDLGFDDLPEPAALTLMTVSMLVEVDHDRSRGLDGSPNVVGVPIALWLGGLPPDSETMGRELRQQLEESAPIGAHVGVLGLAVEASDVVPVRTGPLPALAAMTFELPQGGLMNADPSIDSPIVLRDGEAITSLDQLAALVD